MPGRLVHLPLPNEFKRAHPTRAAMLITGEDGKLVEGSAVKLVSAQGEEIGTRCSCSTNSQATTERSYSSTTEPSRSSCTTGHSIDSGCSSPSMTSTTSTASQARLQTLACLQRGATSSSYILFGGRARRFAEFELYALGGDPDGARLLRTVVPEMSRTKRCRHHGK